MAIVDDRMPDWGTSGAAARARIVELETRVAILEIELAAKPTKRTDEFCDAMQTWLRAIVEHHGDDPQWHERIRAIQSTFRMIHKSSLLWRLLYGCDRAGIRTRKCPTHQGQWGGIPGIDASGKGQHDCPCGLTGWLPNEGASPDASSVSPVEVVVSNASPVVVASAGEETKND